MFVLMVVANAFSFDEVISRQLYWLTFSYEVGSHRVRTIDIEVIPNITIDFKESTVFPEEPRPTAWQTTPTMAMG